MYEIAIPTATHGRVLVEEPTATPAGVFVVFHGYAHNADLALEDARRIEGIGAWRVVAVQALHRFYARGHERVVASWMTTQDRDLAIADNVAYVDRVVDRVTAEPSHVGPIVFAGFSQGVAMAYRAALLGGHTAAGILALGTEIPPELKAPQGPRTWPRVLLGTGHLDPYYTPAKLHADARFLNERGIRHDLALFEGGHEWADAFCQVAARWLREIAGT